MKSYGMPARETDEAACVVLLMRLSQENVGHWRRSQKERKAYGYEVEKISIKNRTVKIQEIIK